MKSFVGKFAAVAIVAAFAVPGVASASRGSGPGGGGPGGGGPVTSRCTGKPYTLVKIADLDGGERARADKVNRNGNDFVCRKDIPGGGGGNTGENSNIKDDKI